MLVVAGATRPCHGETQNGDAWRVDWHGGCCRITLIDALGHGPEAAATAQAAVEALAARPDLDPVESLRLCHRTLGHTRGAVGSVVGIDPYAGQLVYAGIGNVEAQLRLGEKVERPIAYRGILGVTPRTIRPFTFPLREAWLLLLHTDGVSGRAGLPAEPAWRFPDPQGLADAILAQWGRQTDDATVVVAGPPTAAPAG